MSFAGIAARIVSSHQPPKPSPIPKWKLCKNYSKLDVAAAIEAITDGMNAKKAAQKYGIPYGTLYSRMRKLKMITQKSKKVEDLEHVSKRQRIYIPIPAPPPPRFPLNGNGDPSLHGQEQGELDQKDSDHSSNIPPSHDGLDFSRLFGEENSENHYHYFKEEDPDTA